MLSSKELAHELFREYWPEEINSYKEVWLIGGDGIVSYLLNFYKEISIPIAVFKGGTGNDFAWKLYGDLPVKEQIHRILNAQPKKVDAGICNDKIFINGLGIGFDGEVLRSINTVRFLGGHLGYLVIVISKIFTFKEYHFEIGTLEKKFSDKFLLVIIANSSRMGGGFMVSPQGNINDGKLELILCDPLPVLKRLRYLPVIEKGKHLNKNFITHRHINSVTITCEKKCVSRSMEN